MGNSKRVLLIGWDAADWKVIHALMEKGQMPTVKRLIEQGTMGNLRTLSPVLSPMLWTSIATGKRPYKHGIYGFSEPTPDGSGVQPMNNQSRKTKAIWNILNQNDLQSIVVGWWPSHPAEPINGVMVSDFYHKSPKKPGDAWNLLPRSIHPPEMVPELAELRVHPMELTAEELVPFVPHIAEVDQDRDSRLSLVIKTLAECTTIQGAATHLLETQPWDFAAIYFDAIDHFCHGFMRYHPPQQANINDEDFKLYQHVVQTAYIYHDMLLARLLEYCDDDTTVMLISDHGFHPDHLRPEGLPAEPAGPALEHRDLGIFVAKGPGIKQDHLVHSAGLLDIAPTLLSIFGLPSAEDMDGKPLDDIFEQPPAIDNIESWDDVEGDDGCHAPDSTFDPAESKEALEQLIALGYIERPDENTELAISKCTRELDYNLARSYMDAGMHGEAIPLLANLYNKFPLEFRFGIQLANCLRAMNRLADLEALVENLNSGWRVASQEARSRIREVAKIAKERKAHWLELKEMDEKNAEEQPDASPLARTTRHGKPVLFDDQESHSIRKLRAVARGNPQTLDFLSASIASSKQDFSSALEFMEKAELTDSQNPGFQFHLGIVYLGLERTEDAQRAFNKALEIDELHPSACMGLCRMYLDTDRPKKALEFGQRAIGVRYHFPQAHYYLAGAKRRLGDADGAIESLNTAIEQNPNFQEAHELLCKIYKTVQPNHALADYHQTAAEELAEENLRVSESSEKIELPVPDPEKFRADLPEIESQIQNDKFVRCLAQPRDLTALSAKENADEVIVVTGLPRTGTSAMMQMLVAGGLVPFTDNNREADENNPKGYFEADLVKKLSTENQWVSECQGKVVKVVAPLVPYLPQNLPYRFIFMERDYSEILQSQQVMLEQLNTTGANIEDDRLVEVFQRQAKFALDVMRLFDIPVTKVDYADLVADPENVARQIADFVPQTLDVHQMVGAIDPNLYRQRKLVNKSAD